MFRISYMFFVNFYYIRCQERKNSLIIEVMNGSPKLCLYPNRLIIINVCFLYKNMAVIRMRQTIFSYIHHMYQTTISIENLQRNICRERKSQALQCNKHHHQVSNISHRHTSAFNLFHSRGECAIDKCAKLLQGIFLCASILLEDIQSSFCPPNQALLFISSGLFIFSFKLLLYFIKIKKQQSFKKC